MGCDIHIYRERFKDGAWETDTTVEVDETTFAEEYGYESYESGMGYYGRSYWLFAALSGVRAYNDNHPVPPPAEERGFPADATEMNNACLEYWAGDAHSSGYLTINELKKLQIEYENAMVLDESNSQKWLDVSKELTNLIEQASKDDYFIGLPDDDCRILFFYDN